MEITTAIKELNNNKLTVSDRCDSCGAQAYVQVFLDSGDLLFCGHHFKKNEDRLVNEATHIHDELHKLQKTPVIEEDVE